MTQDEIIRMAREAGFEEDSPIPVWLAWESDIQRFAALVAAHEREKNSNPSWETVDDAIAAEREACAKVCDDYIDRLHEMRDNDKSLPQYQPELAGRQAGAGRCAAAIRARGE